MEDTRPRPQEHEFSQDLPDVQGAFQPAKMTGPETTPKVVSEKNLAGEAIKKSPEAALSHATASAERNDPLELVYERRQEVKDQATPQVATPVGSILPQAPQRPAGMPPLTPQTPLPNQPTDSYPEPIQLPPRAPSLYHQAIIGGFLAAVVVLLILAIILIVG